MPTDKTATDRHRQNNLTLDPLAPYIRPGHNLPPLISFSMTDSFRELSIKFKAYAAINMPNKH